MHNVIISYKSKFRRKLNKPISLVLTNTELIALTMTQIIFKFQTDKREMVRGRKLNRNYHKIHHCNSRGLSVAVFG